LSKKCINIVIYLKKDVCLVFFVTGRLKWVTLLLPQLISVQDFAFRGRLMSLGVPPAGRKAEGL
jgi:hypothetical protein